MEQTTQFKSEGTPVVDTRLRTSGDITEKRQSRRAFGTRGDDGWLTDKELCSVNVMALNMSKSVEVFKGVLLLTVLKYHSIVFVLSRAKTSLWKGPA